MHKPVLKLLVGSWHMLKQIMAFGNPTAGGFTTMKEALAAIAALNEVLLAKYGITIAVSAHWWHELCVPTEDTQVGKSAKWNNPRAISLDEWMEGADAGSYPRIGRIIPPGFGLPGSDYGAFINPDPERRQLAHDMMVLSFMASRRVKMEGHEGSVIYWTGPDGIRWGRVISGDNVLLGHDLNPQLEEWRTIIDGLSGALADALKFGFIDGSNLLIEGKPAGDPCYIDVFTDTTLEIKGINEINTRYGGHIAQWQGEFCHSRGSGQKFVDAMNQAISANVFGGRIHLNSGGLGGVNFTKLLSVEGGTPIGDFPQYVDNDFLPGQGLPEWVEDQVATIRAGVSWSAMTGLPLEVEFDARFCRHGDTIGELLKSSEWVIGVFNDAAGALETTAA